MRPLTDHLALTIRLNLEILLFLPGRGYWKMNIGPLGDKNVMDRSRHRWANWRRQRHLYAVDIQRWGIYINHQIQIYSGLFYLILTCIITPDWPLVCLSTPL